MKLNAKQLRDLEINEHVVPDMKRFPIFLILDNVYDTYNIGGLFRLSDALSIEKLFICGDSEIPPNIKIKRASIGTYKVVPWEYRKTAVEAIKELKKEKNEAQIPISSDFGSPLAYSQAKEGTHPQAKNVVSSDESNKPLIIAIEQASNSVPYQDILYATPIAFVVGNETTGCLPETLAACNTTAEIPMHGINISLNVIVSASIVMYHAYNQLGLLK